MAANRKNYVFTIGAEFNIWILKNYMWQSVERNPTTKASFEEKHV